MYLMVLASVQLAVTKFYWTFNVNSLCRCTTKGEEDYRPMFENFVQDLLSTVNKPEWPSSESLLSLLGRILVSV